MPATWAATNEETGGARKGHKVKHRHINDKTWTVAALDSLLERGDLPDWQELFKALRAGEPGVKERLLISVGSHPELKNFVDAVLEATTSS